MVDTEAVLKMDAEPEKEVVESASATAAAEAEAAPAPVAEEAEAVAEATSETPTETTDDANKDNANDEAKKAEDLDTQIIRQLEYYFGDANLCRDKFLRAQIQDNEGGWVPLKVLLTFKRLASMCQDQTIIVDAISKSKTGLIEISEDRLKLRRHADRPLPEQNEEFRKELMTRTAYLKGFPLEAELTELLSFFNKYGKIENVTMRKYLHKPTKTHKFKGSVFVTFSTIDEATKFVEDEKPLEYKGRPLIKKMQLSYLDEKRQELQKKKAKKENTTPAADAASEPAPFQLPKCSVLAFEKPKEGLTRELIRAAVKNISEEFQIAFIDFNKGDESGHIRFDTEDSAQDFLKLLENNKLPIEDHGELELKVLDDKEEQAFLKKAMEDMANRRRSARAGRPNNRKRRGGYGGHGQSSVNGSEKKQKVQSEEAS